jgi:hypothetical protein
MGWICEVCRTVTGEGILVCSRCATLDEFERHETWKRNHYGVRSLAVVCGD